MKISAALTPSNGESCEKVLQVNAAIWAICPEQFMPVLFWLSTLYLCGPLMCCYRTTLGVSADIQNETVYNLIMLVEKGHNTHIARSKTKQFIIWSCWSKRDIILALHELWVSDVSGLARVDNFVIGLKTIDGFQSPIEHILCDLFLQRTPQVTGADTSYRQISELQSLRPPLECPTSTDHNSFFLFLRC